VSVRLCDPLREAPSTDEVSTREQARAADPGETEAPEVSVVRSRRWVSPFGYPRIKASSQLPTAFRSVARPSSPLSAKASTKCPLDT